MDKKKEEASKKNASKDEMSELIDRIQQRKLALKKLVRKLEDKEKKFDAT